MNAFCNTAFAPHLGKRLFSKRMTALVRKVHGAIAMRVAIPQWRGRIAPVFDAAGNLLLVDVEDGGEVRRKEKRLAQTESSARAAEFLSCGADLLICGAITASLRLRIATAGVRVIPFLCGAVEEVLGAFLDGTLADARYAMPGCRRWRWRGGEGVSPVGLPGGCNRGGTGQGRRRVPGAGIGEGLSGVAADDSCACPQCGRKARRNPGPGQRRNLCPQCSAPRPPS
jgi:predicted Fe-Mo cluster-binding NifX family protein